MNDKNICTLPGSDFELDPDNIELNALVNQHTTRRARARRQAEAVAAQEANRSRIISTLIWAVISVYVYLNTAEGLIVPSLGVPLTWICGFIGLAKLWQLARKWGEEG